MSKLDRQLDEVYGEERVVVLWPEDEATEEIDKVRRQLIREIDRHTQRVPLDLRSVDGAPTQLIDLLIECQTYARSNGKVLAVSSARPEMQSALSGRPRRRTRERNRGTAGDLAKSILDKQHNQDDPSSYDISKAEKIQRPRKATRKNAPAFPKTLQYGVVAAVVVAVLVVFCLVIYNLKPEVVIPEKSFEPGQQALRASADEMNR